MLFLIVFVAALVLSLIMDGGLLESLTAAGVITTIVYFAMPYMGM
jgi:hypothetical protein